MKTSLSVVLALVVGIFLAGGVIDSAEAKRMGGGKSFGGKNSYSQPYQNRQQSAAGPSSAQSPAQAQNAGQRASLASKGGLMGMLGGLALGGLLGALFFGGAFENINFMDVAIFAVIAFVLYKIFAARKRASMPPVQERMAAGSGAMSGPVTEPSIDYSPANRVDHDAATPRSSASFDTDLLFRKDKTSATETNVDTAQVSFRPLPGVIPKDFDSAGFIDGAKAAYQRLQKAWDEGDLADLRQFTTDKVFAELQDQIRARSGENRTELLKVEGELLEVREEGSNVEATVLFDVLMREIDTDTTDDKHVTPVREIWHFTRPARSTQPTWYLDGIQQLEG
ncbi:MAG: Tim44 domain-containing protein [Gammaproteobacteria bacterium]|nr:Tim44 domain-containing protein [Gammaproteobacteria bacterium]